MKLRASRQCLPVKPASFTPNTASRSSHDMCLRVWLCFVS